MDVFRDILLSESVEAHSSDILLSDAVQGPVKSELVNETVSDCNMHSDETISEDKQIVKRVPRGRPRQFEYKTKQDYHKAYYILHKHKWNMDYQCPSCELVCSYVNKGRHEKSSYHLRIIEQKKAMSTNTTTQ